MNRQVLKPDSHARDELRIVTVTGGAPVAVPPKRRDDTTPIAEPLPRLDMDGVSANQHLAHAKADNASHASRLFAWLTGQARPATGWLSDERSANELQRARTKRTSKAACARVAAGAASDC